MGTKLFKILGVSSYFVAALALTASIILVGTSLFYLCDRVGKIDHPEVTLEDYSHRASPEQAGNKIAESTGDETASQASANAKKEAYFKELGQLISKIESSINSFGNKSGQGTTTYKELELWLINNTDGLNDDDYLMFLKALAEETSKIAANTDKLLKLQSSDPQYVDMFKFVEWYTKEYNARYAQEVARYNFDKQVQTVHRAQGFFYLACAGGVFSVFVLFTIVLLLVKIEYNTRQAAERGIQNKQD